MNTLEELRALLSPLAHRLPLTMDKGEIWTAKQTFEVDGDVDQYRSYLASCGSNTFGALAVAAINALPGLLDRVERLEDLLVEIGNYAHGLSTGPAVPDELWSIRDMAYGGLETSDERRERVKREVGLELKEQTL